MIFMVEFPANLRCITNHRIHPVAPCLAILLPNIQVFLVPEFPQRLWLSGDFAPLAPVVLQLRNVLNPEAGTETWGKLGDPKLVMIITVFFIEAMAIESCDFP